MYLASPFSMFILQSWPRICRFSSLIGLFIACAGIVASSFATRVWQLIITQGVVYAIGACMLYYPVLIFLDEWFVRRKGLAFGVCWVSRCMFPSNQNDYSNQIADGNRRRRRDFPLPHQVRTLALLIYDNHSSLGCSNDYTRGPLLALRETTNPSLWPLGPTPATSKLQIPPLSIVRHLPNHQPPPEPGVFCSFSLPSDICPLGTRRIGNRHHGSRHHDERWCGHWYGPDWIPDRPMARRKRPLPRRCLHWLRSLCGLGTLCIPATAVYIRLNLWYIRRKLERYLARYCRGGTCNR